MLKIITICKELFLQSHFADGFEQKEIRTELRAATPEVWLVSYLTNCETDSRPVTDTLQVKAIAK